MIRSFGDLCKCQETSSSVLLVWRLAACASRQADGTQTCDSGHSASRALGGREGSAKRNGAAETLVARDRCARHWRCQVPCDSACDRQAVTV